MVPNLCVTAVHFCTPLPPHSPHLSCMVFLLGWALLRRWVANCGAMPWLSSDVKGPVGGQPWSIQKDVTGKFFTMLTFSQSLCIYLQWMTVFNWAIVCKAEPDLPAYGQSACQCNRDTAPRCTLIIPYRPPVIAQYSCQSSAYNLTSSHRVIGA